MLWKWRERAREDLGEDSVFIAEPVTAALDDPGLVVRSVEEPERHQRAGTLPLAGRSRRSRRRSASSERRDSERPYVLARAAERFDPRARRRASIRSTRTATMPNGSRVDIREGQIERYAPAFRDRIEEAKVISPADLESGNASLLGGDSFGGRGRPGADLCSADCQLQSIPNVDPHRLLLSSTPPGLGVRGVCGYHAARAAIKALGE